MALTFQQLDILELLRHRVGQLEEQDDKLDQKAKDNIQTLSIIFGFVSAFNLLDALAESTNALLFLLIVALYLVSVTLCFYTLLPKKWIGVLNNNPDELRSFLGRKNETAYFWQLVYAYSDAVAYNESVIRLKARIVQWSMFISLIDIVLIILLAVR